MTEIKEITEPEINNLFINLRQAIADYMYSEGCSCCRDIEAHKEHEKRLAELLKIELYDDNNYNQ